MPGGGWLWARYDRPPLPSPAPDILIAAALGTLLSGGAAAWLAGRVSRPLSALAYASDEVARGRTAPRLKVRGPDDIRLAAEAFNAMSDRVTRTLESQRQLLSAVGHDLRTPLAAMRITAEFVEDGEVRERLARNIEELQSLTEAVLSAARAGPGEEKRRVDLAALIESVCDDLVELGMPVEVNISGSAPCLCRPSEIRRATRNLIENAARYGGEARVSLATEGDSFVVTVNDNGPGIPEDKLEEVFEPFVRLEASRNAATGGAGLGLTLARSIAKEHGGDVVLENRVMGGQIAGLKASLRLPCEAKRQKPAAAVAPEKVAT
jgi:signal transduction histidine kinase